jgi:plastocyanin
MDSRVIAGRYEILETLFENELQASYTAKKLGSEDSKHYIVNEFKDTDTVYAMKDNFSREKCRYIKNIVETFYEEFYFYVVCNICSGPPLEYYLSNNNLRLTEKMYLTESLLSQLADMEKLSPFIVYSLCDTDNMTVTGKRNICFNCNLKLTAEKIAAKRSDVSRKTGEIISAIFSNTIATDLNYTKDNMPPALFTIVQNCLEGKYDSIAKVYTDFKGLLLYSVFMGNKSVDTELRKNFQKAKIKRKLTPVRRLAAVLIVALLAAGIWTVVKDLDIATWNKGNTVVQNSKPAVTFTMSRSQILEGDTVVFTSQASDPDANDSIKSYDWTITMDGKPIFASSRENISHTFLKTGNYSVSLVVTDSNDLPSDPYTEEIYVLPKPEASDTGTADEPDK